MQSSAKLNPIKSFLFSCFHFQPKFQTITSHLHRWWNFDFGFFVPLVFSPSCLLLLFFRPATQVKSKVKAFLIHNLKWTMKRGENHGRILHSFLGLNFDWKKNLFFYRSFYFQRIICFMISSKRWWWFQSSSADASMIQRPKVRVDESKKCHPKQLSLPIKWKWAFESMLPLRSLTCLWPSWWATKFPFFQLHETVLKWNKKNECKTGFFIIRRNAEKLNHQELSKELGEETSKETEIENGKSGAWHSKLLHYNIIRIMQVQEKHFGKRETFRWIVKI